jgi:hypothetical protein
MKHAVPALMLLMLSACVSNRPQYQEPIEGNAPLLTISTSAHDSLNIAVVAYEGEEYLESRGKVVTLLNSKAIGYDFSSEKTIRVAPGRTFRFSIRTGDQTAKGDKLIISACITHTSFVPAAGYRYLARHATVPGGCSTMIYRDVPGGIVPEPTAKKHPACADPNLGFRSMPNACTPDFVLK